MPEQIKEQNLYQIADKFIALANDLVHTEEDVGKVSSALRFAAARFNAFEAAIKSADLTAEKDNALEWFTAEFKDMLNDNLDDHIANPPATQESDKDNASGDSIKTY